MPNYAVLLRGVNLGSRNRIPMPALRDALAVAGYADVRTYLQSGNIVLSTDAPPGQLADDCKRLIRDRFDLDIEVVVRTRDELAEIVKRNPLGNVAKDPKRYQVSFLAKKPSATVVKQLASLAVGGEQLVHFGRELYAWHPDGIGRSKLAAQLAGPKLRVTATARNWTTVTQLLELLAE